MMVNLLAVLVQIHKVILMEITPGHLIQMVVQLMLTVVDYPATIPQAKITY